MPATGAAALPGRTCTAVIYGGRAELACCPRAASPPQGLYAVGMALVEVQRVSGGYTEHLHPFEVVIDDEVVGRLGPGESGAFRVAPGTHEVFAKIYWCRSEKIGVDLRRDEKVTYRCQTRASLLTEGYWATLGRHRYLRLTQLTS